MAKREKPIKKEFWYYKTVNGKGWLKDKRPYPNKGYIEITEQEWNEHMSLKHHEPTAEQLAKRETRKQIAKLKSQLAATDYQALKHSEGWISEEDYAPIKVARQEIRDKINELEATL